MKKHISAILLGGLLAAQSTDQEYTLRITVNLVEVDAVVTDRQGNAVKDLTAADFEVLQDGKPQQVRRAQWIEWGATATAAPKTPPPKGTVPVPIPGSRNLDRQNIRRTVAIVVDDLGLSFESVARLRDALKTYIRDRMQPNDLVAIVTTGRSVGAMSQFTSDKRLLLAAVEHLRWNSWGRAGVSAMQTIGLTPEERGRRMAGATGPPPNPDTDPEVMRQQMFLNGTMSALTNVVEGLRQYPGRKSLLLISESMPITLRSQQGNAATDNTQSIGVGTLGALQRLGDLASRNFVVIDSIDPRGLMVGGLTAADDVSDMRADEVQARVQNRNSDVFESQNGLNYLATTTGGTFQFNDNDLTRMVTKAADGVGGYYLITYTPDEGTFAPSKTEKWHRVKVRVKRAGLRVRAREGFIGRPDNALPPMSAKPERLIDAMTSAFAESSIGIRLTGFHVEDPKGGTMVSALVHIDAKDIEFKPNKESDKSDASVEIIAVSLNADGKIESQTAKGYNISLTPESLEKTKRDGFLFTMYHAVKKPGGFQLRVGVKDRQSGRMGTATQYLEVPDAKKGNLLLSSLIVRGDVRNSLSSPAMRIFEPNSQVLWGAHVLNAKRDKQNQPQLTLEVIVYRNGTRFYQSPARPWDEAKVDDPKRLPATGMLKFGSKLEPGEYVLQLVVRDKLQNDQKRAVATQAIDFEVRNSESSPSNGASKGVQ